MTFGAWPVRGCCRVAHHHGRVQFAEVPNAPFLAGCSRSSRDGRALDNASRASSASSLVLRVRPFVDVKMLVVATHGKFVDITMRTSASEFQLAMKIPCLRVIESGNLLCEHLHQRLFQRIVLRKQPEFSMLF